MAQPNPEHGPDDHCMTDWEDVHEDVFQFEEYLLQKNVIGAVDWCIQKAIKICTNLEQIFTDAKQLDNLNAVQHAPLPPTARKVSEFPVPRKKPKSMRGAELIEANFIKAMDKTYFSIRKI